MVGRGGGPVPCALLGATLAAAVPASVADSLVELTALYRAGQAEPGLTRLARWDAKRLQREGELLVRSADQEAGAAAGLPLAQVAALLHAHRALLDLEAASFERSRLQVAAATALLRAAPAEQACEACAAFERQLFLLASLVSQSLLDLGPARACARAGLERHADDPELLTALGSMEETAASIRSYLEPPGAHASAFGRSSFAIEGDSGPAGHFDLPGGSLKAAEAAFAQALVGDPALREARLRLGRVRDLRGRANDGLPELERVGYDDDAPPRQRYLAWLFAGRAHEQLAEFAAAAAAYRAALAAEPEAQSAWVGLAYSLERLGERDGAQAAIDAALRPEGARQDPWWSYVLGQPERLHELLESLRGELAR